MWYSVHQDGIQPMWEDEQNKKGGRWLVNVNKNQRHHDLDNVWQEIVSTCSFNCDPVRVSACLTVKMYEHGSAWFLRNSLMI